MTKDELEAFRGFIAYALASATEQRKSVGTEVSEEWQQGYDWAAYLVNALFENLKKGKS